MTEDILFWMFAVASTLYVFHIAFYLVGANIYDIRQFQRLHHHHRKNGFRSHPQDTLVTVLIPAHNEEKVILRCLESIRKSTYKNLQIVIADDASSDSTVHIARNYRRRHRDLNISIARVKEHTGKGGVLNFAFERFAKGEFIMTLDADSVLSRTSIRHALYYFADPTVAGVAANVRIIEEPTVLGVLQKLEHLIGYRSKKLYSITNSEFVVGGVASTYRADMLRKVGFYDTDTLTEDIGLSLKIVSHGNKQHRMIYAADVAAETEGVSTFTALLRQRYRWKYGSLQNLVKYRRLIGRLDKNFTASLTIYRLPMAVVSELVLLLAPFIWIYVIYITISFSYPYLILGAYLTITGYTLMTLWFDEHASYWHRLRLSFYAPLAYLIFYIMDVVQFVAVVRCLAKTHHLVKRKNIGSAWVPTQRAGKEIL